jgi:hypothetical protein
MVHRGSTWLLVGLALVAATGCGSAASGSSTSSTAGTASTAAAAGGVAVANPKALVKAILPREVPGMRLLKVETETLKDQLVPPYAGAEVEAAGNRIVRASWLASGHTYSRPDGHKVVVVVDVNLFRTTSDAKRLFAMEQALRPPAPNKLVTENVPTGAAPESAYTCASKPGYSGCTLVWRQGAVIAYVQLLGKGPSALNPGVAEELVPLLLPVQLQVAKSISGQCVMSDGTLKQAA